jgi:type IV secretion system protein VirB10
MKEIVTKIEKRASADSKLEALLTKLLEEKIQRGKSAQKASVNFQNFSIPKKDHSSPDNNTLSSSAPGSPNESASNPRDDDNRQDEKNEYLDKKRDSDVILASRIQAQRSPYQVMAGTLIPGLLLSGLNSDLPGQIVGQVSQNVFDTKSGAYLLIPQGAKVLGQYDSRVVYGQERVLIVWTRIIFPNGKSISLEGMPGVDLSGYAGLSDQVNNHWGRLITGVVFSSLLSAGSQVAQGRNYSSFDPSYDELATQGAARNLNQVGQMITRRNLNVQPTLEIRPGFRFNVFVHKDMILEPYKLN